MSNTDKATKLEARYTPKGTQAEHCAICRHYTVPNQCERVRGGVSAGGWCKFFQKRRQAA